MAVAYGCVTKQRIMRNATPTADMDADYKQVRFWRATTSATVFAVLSSCSAATLTRAPPGG